MNSRAVALLDELLDASAADRARRLDELRAVEPETVALLEKWLEADERDDPSALAPGHFAPLVAAADAGQQLGPWRLTRELGSGGMGVVWLAERADGQFEQHVALKRLRAGSQGMVVRFMRERRILATLDHPNIARIVDAGLDTDGMPWFAMELVSGAPITEWCDARSIGLRARVALFREACAAVRHAHQRLVVHRDLKPGNVFVDGRGTPKLLDFGIAKLLDAASATETRAHTPDYAAPEQITGGPVTTATDVHALGVLLYELVAGAHPWRGSASTAFSVQKAIVERDAPRASQLALGSVPWSGALRGDLERILAHALEKDPARRYPSVEALDADLARWLEHRPIALGNARFDRVLKFLRRNSLAVGTAATISLALVVATAVSVYQASRARAAAVTAQREATTSNAVRRFLLDAFTSADPYRTDGRAVSARELLEAGSTRVGAMVDQPAVQAELHEAFGDVFTKLDQGSLADAQYVRALDAYARAGERDSPRAIGVELGRLTARYEASSLTGLEAELRSLLARVGARSGDWSDARMQALSLLAFTQQTEGRYDEAATSAEELRTVAATAGSREGEAFALYQLVLVRMDQQRIADAADAFLRFVALDRMQLSPGSPGLVTDVQLGARLLHASGRPGPARALAAWALDARQRHFGAAHRLTLAAAARLGDIEFALGEREVGRDRVATSLTSLARSLGARHDDVAALREQYAAMLASSGEIAHARTEWLLVADSWRARGGDSHPRLLAAAAALEGMKANGADASRLRAMAAARSALGVAAPTQLPSPATLDAIAELASAIMAAAPTR